MENQYGITVANIYNLFLEDNSEDVQDILQNPKVIVKADKVSKTSSTGATSKKTAKNNEKSAVHQTVVEPVASLEKAAAPILKSDGKSMRSGAGKSSGANDGNLANATDGKSPRVTDGKSPRVGSSNRSRRPDDRQGEQSLQSATEIGYFESSPSRPPRQQGRGSGNNGAAREGGTREGGPRRERSYRGRGSNRDGFGGEIRVGMGFGGDRSGGGFSETGESGKNQPSEAGGGGADGGGGVGTGFGRSQRSRGGGFYRPRSNRGFGNNRSSEGDGQGGFNDGQVGEDEGGVKPMGGEGGGKQQRGGGFYPRRRGPPRREGGGGTGEENGEGGPIDGNEMQNENASSEPRRQNRPNSNRYNRSSGEGDGGRNFDGQQRFDRDRFSNRRDRGGGGFGQQARSSGGFGETQSAGEQTGEGVGTIEHWAPEDGAGQDGGKGRIFSRTGRRGGGGGGYYRDRQPRYRDRDNQPSGEKRDDRPMDKRDGSGARNWGTIMDDLDAQKENKDGEGVTDHNEGAAERGGTKSSRGRDGGDEPQTPAEEEEPAVMTLDEWKKLQEPERRVKSDFNVRQAGEGCGEDANWKKMFQLKKKEEEREEGEEEETEEEKHTKHSKNLLPIEIKFLDDTRHGGAGMGGGRGRGGERRGSNRGGGERDRGNRESGYRGNRDGGYRGDREGFNRGDREGGNYRSGRGDREGGNYHGDRGGSIRGDREGGNRGDREAGYRNDRGGGYRGDRDGGYRGERSGGYRDDRNSRGDGDRTEFYRDGGGRGRDGRTGGQRRDHAPNVDDEKDFPSLVPTAPVAQ